MDYRIERCGSCRAAIIFAKTADSVMPVNAEPCDDGDIALTPAGGGQPFARVVMVGQLALGEDVPVLHKSHFATCPDAPAWRKPDRRHPPRPRRTR